MSALRRKFSDLNLKDDRAIISSARKGVRPQVFYSFSAMAAIPEKSLATLLHVHPRTMSNYRTRRKALNPVEGEHLLKLIHLFTVGEDIFGGLDPFLQWLKMPDWTFRKETPMDWLNTPGGVDLVLLEIKRLGHGYVA